MGGRLARVESGKFAETYEKGRKRRKRERKRKTKGRKRRRVFVPSEIQLASLGLGSFLLGRGRGWGLILASVRSERYGQGQRKEQTDGTRKRMVQRKKNGEKSFVLKIDNTVHSRMGIRCKGIPAEA